MFVCGACTRPFRALICSWVLTLFTAGPKPTNAKPDKTNLIINDFDFVSSIITEDEYSVSKLPPSSTETASSSKLKELKGQSVVGSRYQSVQEHKINNKKSDQSKMESKSICMVDFPSTSNTCQDDSVKPVAESGDTLNNGKIDGKLGANGLKSSLKSTGAEKVRSVTWADEKEMNSRNGNLCDVREVEDTEGGTAVSDDACFEDRESSLRFSSAEACAMALNQAAENVASGKSDVSDAGT